MPAWELIGDLPDLPCSGLLHPVAQTQLVGTMDHTKPPSCIA